MKNNPGMKLIEVQHHYAHVLSVMAENHFYKQVIGVAYDGTGYGDDGTIWGGEIFLCDLNECERKWHISPFIFSGGDVAAERYLERRKILGANPKEDVTCEMLGRQINECLDSEMFCKNQKPRKENSSGDIHSTAELFYRIVDEKLGGKDSEELAYFFHKELARITVDGAVRIREESGCKTVALSGGCFQNTLLLALTKSGFEEKGFTVLTAHEVPPNDGGISLGQCLKGIHDLRKDIL